MQRNKIYSKAALASSLAIAASLPASPAAAQGEGAREGNRDTVVVTSTRRETGLQDTPIAVTAFSENELKDIGAESFIDYSRFVPGLFSTDLGPSRKKYVLRGVQSEITTGDSASTVAQYLDDIPLTAFGVNQPDPILVDINRVEILRGPQGTLYGASSMGGTVRTITNKPVLDEHSGSLGASVSATRHGGINYSGEGVINLPIVEDKFALRGVLTYEKHDGFIDNITTGQDNVNSDDRFGARIMARWAPTNYADIVAYFMHQQSQIDASWRTDVASGELRQTTALLENYKDNLNIANLTANFDTGFGTITSATSYFDRDDSTRFIDQEFAFALGFLGPLGAGAFADGDSESDGFAQEVRFASAFEGPLQILFGAFYNESNDTSLQNLYDVNGVSKESFPDAPSGDSNPVFEEIIEKDLRDISGFGEVSLEILPGLTATAGVRYFDVRYEFTDTVTVPPTWLGPFIDPDPEPSILTSKANGTNLKFHLAYESSDNLLLYAQAAEGFRRGGTNIANTFRSFVPATYEPDGLWSYEFGWKSALADDTLILNGAIYQIDWSDIQIKSLLVGDNGFGGTAFAFGVVNSGKARIRGVELESQWHITNQLSLIGTVNYMDSELVEDAPGAQPYRGLNGDKLPGNANWQWSAAAEYSHPLSNGLDFWFRADASYLGDRTTELRPLGLDASGVIDPTDMNPNYFTMESYTVLGLRASLRSESWELTAFANNLNDKRADQLFFVPFGQTAAGVQKTTIRPRTIGINALVRF